MKKSIKCTIALLMSSITLVFANSGPTYWQGYPSSNIMTVDKNSPIEIKNENLTFDFSHEENDSYSVQADVTAEYNMFNPTNEPIFVQMAFPFVERLNNINYDDITITTDNIELDYEVYLGNSVDNHNGFSENNEGDYNFEEIVNKISNDIYKAKSFSQDEVGRLYIFEIKPTTNEGIDFTVKFNYDHEKTNIIIQNFNSFSRDDGKVQISSGCYEPQTAEIFVLGEDVEFSVAGYTIGSSKKETSLFTYEVTEKEIDVKTYLLDYLKIYTENVNPISDIQLYNLYASALDKYFEYNLGFCSEHDIFAASYDERVITLVYTVEFPPAAGQKVSVSYKTSGTMDKRETVLPQYSFDYILNPAKNWSSFNNLNIKIITPEEAPYIIDSSIEFKRENNNVYSASLKTLPEEDLSFTLYSKEEATLLDKAEGRLNRSFGYFAPIVIVIAGIVTFIVIALIMGKIKKRNVL